MTHKYSTGRFFEIFVFFVAFFGFFREVCLRS